ncbi:DUF6233 domain-containing protein [Streptomyces sp. NPDC048438]|uniref:DUF6233 domain-containing protein n=1 Tax=Streptomyces sp. NPDC048438 TaxID=3365551 RepID=UPI00371E4A23
MNLEDPYLSDLPPDPPRLRTFETWLALTLEQVRERIAAGERREAEVRQGRSARPPVPDWTIELVIGQGKHPLYVHVAGCHLAGELQQPVSREAAARAVTEAVAA